MNPSTAITVAVLALVLIVAILAWLGGTLVERMRKDTRELEAEARGFDQGADLAEKTRRLGERARRLGR